MIFIITVSLIDQTDLKIAHKEGFLIKLFYKQIAMGRYTF